jgi:hypothetical protein
VVKSGNNKRVWKNAPLLKLFAVVAVPQDLARFTHNIWQIRIMKTLLLLPTVILTQCYSVYVANASAMYASTEIFAAGGGKNKQAADPVTEAVEKRFLGSGILSVYRGDLNGDDIPDVVAVASSDYLKEEDGHAADSITCKRILLLIGKPG